MRILAFVEMNMHDISSYRRIIKCKKEDLNVKRRLLVTSDA
jgi:hypothetical protein